MNHSRLSYSYFKASLANLGILIVIGFSFRDAEIRQLIWETLKSRSDFRLIVIDPAFGDIASVVTVLSEGEVPDYLGHVDVIPYVFGEVSTLDILRERLLAADEQSSSGSPAGVS
jgi:hypothetical protein